MTSGKIGRPAVYLLHCVQEHMRIQGDRYLEEAKGPRRAVATETLKGLGKADKAQQQDQAVRNLAEIHRALARRRQSRCKGAAETQQELFKAPAKRGNGKR